MLELELVFFFVVFLSGFGFIVCLDEVVVIDLESLVCCDDVRSLLRVGRLRWYGGVEKSVGDY